MRKIIKKIHKKTFDLGKKSFCVKCELVIQLEAK